MYVLFLVIISIKHIKNIIVEIIMLVVYDIINAICLSQLLINITDMELTIDNTNVIHSDKNTLEQFLQIIFTY